MKKNQIPKIKAIIRTLLITTGPKTAREISEFIDCNNFQLGQSISAQQVASIMKYDYQGILKDVKTTNTHTKKYYITPDIYVKNEILGD